MVRGLRKTGDLLARSDLCHLHVGGGRARGAVRSEPARVVVRRSLSEIINGRLRRRSDASSTRPLTRATA